jgi:hypothetical protein
MIGIQNRRAPAYRRQARRQRSDRGEFTDIKKALLLTGLFIIQIKDQYL